MVHSETFSLTFPSTRGGLIEAITCATEAFLPQNESPNTKSSEILCITGAYRYSQRNQMQRQWIRTYSSCLSCKDLHISEHIEMSRPHTDLTDANLYLAFGDKTFASGLRVEVKQIMMVKAQF